MAGKNTKMMMILKSLLSKYSIFNQVNLLIPHTLTCTIRHACTLVHIHKHTPVIFFPHTHMHNQACMHTSAHTQTHTSHFGQVRTFVDPRLITKVVNEFPRRYGIRGYRSIRNSFNSLVKADLVLKDVDLSNTVAVVTGGNSGLGMFNLGISCLTTCTFLLFISPEKNRLYLEEWSGISSKPCTQSFWGKWCQKCCAIVGSNL